MASCSPDGLTVYWLLQTTDDIRVRIHTYTYIYLYTYICMYWLHRSLARFFWAGTWRWALGCVWVWAKHENCFDIKKKHSTVKKSSFLVGHARHDADTDREQTGDGRRTGKWKASAKRPAHPADKNQKHAQKRLKNNQKKKKIKTQIKIGAALGLGVWVWSLLWLCWVSRHV